MIIVTDRMKAKTRCKANPDPAIIGMSGVFEGEHHAGREEGAATADKVFLELSVEALPKALQSGVLEVRCA